MKDFPRFPKTCRSMLCKYLRPEVFEALNDAETPSGFTLEDAIRSGVENPDSSIGVYAGDKESYFLFAALFDPIIESYHGFGVRDMHVGDFDPAHLHIKDPDPEGRYILSTRIRVGRNLEGYPLGAAISRQMRDEVARRIVAVLERLEGDLAGHYYPLAGMSEEDRASLVADHFLFKAGDRFLESAGLNRDWPEGRGIYHNDAKTFLVWVNEEDQLRIISMQKGSDIAAVFARLAAGVGVLERELGFLQSPHLGYITSCPTNLGTAMRASVHIRLPYLAKDRALFEAICDAHHLQIRGVHGEHSESEGGVFDVSNRRRLGVSEVQCVRDLAEGVSALIAREREIERN